MKLSLAVPHKLYEITALTGDESRLRRLLDMGFTPGSEIYVSGVAPLGGTILVSLRGYSVALRESAARIIQVTPKNGL